jgi:sulfide:quinone oxidoreductase
MAQRHSNRMAEARRRHKLVTVNPPPIRNFGGAPARVVIAGGGVGGLEAMLALRRLAKERVSINLVAPTHEFVYRALSVLEPFETFEAPRFNLDEIAVDLGARHHLDVVTAVDAERRHVKMQSGRELGYDVLVVAVGARHGEAIPGALTFGAANGRPFADLLVEAERGIAPRIVFAVPPGVVWALPLYELALNTAAHLAARGLEGIEMTLVTPEDSPLALFGQDASGVVRGLLGERGIKLKTGSYPVAVEDGKVTLVPRGQIEADRVVALPRLEGPELRGMPQDEAGFIATDEHGLVHGLEDVYAVGDATTFPVKQGGITAEQADAAAEAIASRAGAPITPRPFRPVLRGMLLTGGEPRYLSANITRGPAIESETDVEPLWWPPSKIPGRYLAHYLQERGKELAVPPAPAETARIPFEVDLTAMTRPRTGGPANGTSA